MPKCCQCDDEQLIPVHALAPNHICQRAKEELAEERASRCDDLYRRIAALWNFVAIIREVAKAYHVGDKVDGEDLRLWLSIRFAVAQYISC